MYYSEKFKSIYYGSSGGLTREVQVVARGSSGVLAKHFRKLDHDT
jgi:hypothetical protein